MPHCDFIIKRTIDYGKKCTNESIRDSNKYGKYCELHNPFCVDRKINFDKLLEWLKLDNSEELFNQQSKQSQIYIYKAWIGLMRKVQGHIKKLNNCPDGNVDPDVFLNFLKQSDHQKVENILEIIDKNFLNDYLNKTKIYDSTIPVKKKKSIKRYFGE
jgi:hypothetical protein